MTDERQPADDSWDFVVVGSGAGGGPLAARLALEGFRVLVLEAGDDHACPYYSVPIMQAYASEDPDMRWDFFVRHWDDETTQARDPKYVAERSGVFYPRGSTVGGSTAVSAMVTMVPQDGDWERIAALTGDPSWSPAAMREQFRRLESWRGVDARPLPGQDEEQRDRAAAHGRDGWLGTTRADPALAGREPRFLQIIDAIEQTARARFAIPDEVSLPRDINAADTPDDFEGMTFVPVAVRDGSRNGSRERLADVAARHPDRLTILTNCLATRVVFEGTRAVGVEYLTGRRLYAAAPGSSCTAGAREEAPVAQERRIARASAEVILAGGAFNTPQLLALSGIGPREDLERLGIDVLRDAPGVGANLHDRYEVSVVAELAEDYPIFDGSPLDVPADDASADALFAEWRDEADGPFTTNGSLAAIVARSSVADRGSDLVVFALPIDFQGYYPGYSRDLVSHHDRLSVVVLKGHTGNRAGRVALRSADPRDVPEIGFRYFEEGSGDAASDLRGVIDGVEIAREVVSRLGGDVIRRELVPGPAVATDAELAAFVREQSWGHHACGTAKIGPASDPEAVVDGDFRVHGVDRLRVVDASVFPDIPGLFIATAVYMISEKAAEVLAAAHRPARG